MRDCERIRNHGGTEGTGEEAVMLEAGRPESRERLRRAAGMRDTRWTVQAAKGLPVWWALVGRTRRDPMMTAAIKHTLAVASITMLELK